MGVREVIVGRIMVVDGGVVLPSWLDSVSVYTRVTTARTNAMVPQYRRDRISPTTLALLRHRHTLKSVPNGHVAYVLVCPAARSALERDLTEYKQGLLLDAMRNGTDMRKARERTYHFRKRMLFRDQKGYLSQSATEAKTQEFYNKLYSPRVPLRLPPLPHRDEPCPPFLLSKVRASLEYILTSKAPGPDGVTPQGLVREELTDPLNSVLNHLLSSQPMPPEPQQSNIEKTLSCLSICPIQVSWPHF